MIALNLLVLHAKEPDKLAQFYEKLGMRFHREQHGSGPEHYCCEQQGQVFEIYPLAQNEAATTRGIRLGFSVEFLDRVMDRVKQDAHIVSPPKVSSWGYRAVIDDPEGNRIELLEQRHCINPS